MNDGNEIRLARFVVFCLEAYKRAEGISGAEAVERFSRHGVTDYLRTGYDVLHSLGEASLIADIRDFLARRQGVPCNVLP